MEIGYFDLKCKSKVYFKNIHESVEWTSNAKQFLIKTLGIFFSHGGIQVISMYNREVILFTTIKIFTDADIIG